MTNTRGSCSQVSGSESNGFFTKLPRRLGRTGSQRTSPVTLPAEPLTAQEMDDAVIAGLRDRLGAIERAETRLREGAFGRSIASGQAIPDERLEADPAAELTVEEASEG